MDHSKLRNPRSPFALIAVRGTLFFAGPSNGVFGVFVGRGFVEVTGGDRTVVIRPGLAPTLPTPVTVYENLHAPSMWRASPKEKSPTGVARRGSSCHAHNRASHGEVAPGLSVSQLRRPTSGKVAWRDSGPFIAGCGLSTETKPDARLLLLCRRGTSTRRLCWPPRQIAWSGLWCLFIGPGAL